MALRLMLPRSAALRGWVNVGIRTWGVERVFAAYKGLRCSADENDAI